ncbi:MAG: CHAD domain-containing protein [Vicinamibacterales bacterium]
MDVSYCLKPGHPVARDIRLIITRQLTRALPELDATGARVHDHAIHEARRHLKKTMAVLRLVKPVLGHEYGDALTRMKVASRMLAPIADAEALVDSVDALGRHGTWTQLDRATIRAIRSWVLARERRVDRKATVDDVLEKVKHLLTVEQRQVDSWTFRSRGFASIAPGLERSMRRATRAMERAAAHPTCVTYHVWRRRVKDLWFQVRLIERRCGYGLSGERRRLEALDDLLGQCHNLSLLQDALVTDPPVSRDALARCLRSIRGRRTVLRRRALAAGRRLFSEKPRLFVRRVETLWKTNERRTEGRREPPSWRHT